MIENETTKMANRIFQAIFGRDNPYSLTEMRTKFASKLHLPTMVQDSRTAENTYTILPEFGKFITDQNSALYDEKEGWMLPPREVHNLRELFAVAKSINYLTTERVYDSDNVHASDPIYESENVYGSANCGRSKNLLFCDGTYNSDYAIACARSDNVNFCLCVDDSNSCSNSYAVICSGKISNSLFIQDASDLHECILCSHLSNKQFCVANMEFSEKNYYYLKQCIIDWIFASNFADPLADL